MIKTMMVVTIVVFISARQHDKMNDISKRCKKVRRQQNDERYNMQLGKKNEKR